MLWSIFSLNLGHHIVSIPPSQKVDAEVAAFKQKLEVLAPVEDEPNPGDVEAFKQKLEALSPSSTKSGFGVPTVSVTARHTPHVPCLGYIPLPAIITPYILPNPCSSGTPHVRSRHKCHAPYPHNKPFSWCRA